AEPLDRNARAAWPHNAHGWTNLGALLRSRSLYEPSIAMHRKALQVDPGLDAARSNLANALADHGCFGEAETLRRALHEADPDDPVRLRDLCAALRGLGRHDEVIALVDAAEARLTDVDECLLQRSLSYLMKGNYQQGFADFERRYAGNEVSLPDDAPWPRWLGEEPRGRKILVMPEQGFGDAVLMSRFLPDLKARGAEVSMIVKPPLRRLLARLEGLDHMLDAARASASFDFYTPNMSLPHLVGLAGGAPPPLPRLTIPDDSRSRARALCAAHDASFRIGVVWTGSTTYRANNRRSTGPESFLGLATVPGVQLFSLYKGAAHDAFLNSGMAGLIVDACGTDRDFADTAAVIKKMDLLITTDTAVVHIAASLGRPVWNLLSREGYWLYGQGDTTPWYPSIRLFRQQVQGDWAELFGRVEAALRAHLEDRKS
ncbi:MAG: glycosyltransferase family 9 protein, partial [Limibaculum sp.]